MSNLKLDIDAADGPEVQVIRAILATHSLEYLRGEKTQVRLSYTLEFLSQQQYHQSYEALLPIEKHRVRLQATRLAKGFDRASA